MQHVLLWYQTCLAICREAVLYALSPLGSIGSGIADGKGAIYLWAKLPEGVAIRHTSTVESLMDRRLHEHNVYYAQQHVRANAVNVLSVVPHSTLPTLTDVHEQAARTTRQQWRGWCGRTRCASSPAPAAARQVGPRPSTP